MSIELLQIAEFLQTHHPFMLLNKTELMDLVRNLEVRYWHKDEKITEDQDHLYVLRSGALEVYGRNAELLARLAEGDCFGYQIQFGENYAQKQYQLIEDALIYQIPVAVLDSLSNENAEFAAWVSTSSGERIHEAIRKLGQDKEVHLNLMATKAGRLLAKDPISVTQDTSIQAAAEKMSAARISSILVIDNDTLLGIVTDRDLRIRVVAKGLAYDTNISEIMTRSPATIDADQYAFDALLLMAKHTIHHVPVMRQGRVAGVISATDLNERNTSSAVYLSSNIAKQDTIEALQQASQKLPELMQTLAAADASADSAGRLITLISDSLTSRLLQLAEGQFGPAPVAYAWVAAGSQARSEQTAHSDQDNCLVLSDAYDEKQHGDYFLKLSNFVCDGLNACGYIYCPGDVMAKNPEWRQPLKQWKNYFSLWTGTPEPKALMLSCVFFDMRLIYGESSLLEQLREFMLIKTRGNKLFLAHMAANALTHQPPLGFFRQFTLIRGGEHAKTFDMKHKGIIPIVDLARVYALASGKDAVNTQDRLAACAGTSDLTQDGGRDLSDALEFICDLRIRHQAQQLLGKQAADNYISPDDLSDFERQHLKEAFIIVRTMQTVLEQRYRLW